ncbi:MAG: dependent oxidoreductase [Gemmatimonadetes bacterium]|nr:dependent oxidoreductase [Gemmatimonadota bacterium]
MPSIAVIGGGLVGLASALKLQQTGRFDRVVLLEKERDVGQHQSTHNSGVLHAGLYYAPGSLKARFAIDGLREMVAFCREHGIAHEQCGKVVVATDESELDRLNTLHERGQKNGLTGLKKLNSAELREIEPHARGIAAVRVPEEGIVDYAAVCQTLKRLIVSRGGEVLVEASVRSIGRVRDSESWTILAGTHTLSATVLVNCAGLHADRIARLAGVQTDLQIVPFRGEYYTLRADRAFLVRNLIYPVPNPAFPFLGVHLTRMVHGGIEAGPNATLAAAREGYRKGDVDLRDLGEAISFSGLWRFIARYPRLVTYEVARSRSPGLFLKSLQRLVPELRLGDIIPGPSGVRAQAMRRNGELVQDFEVVERPGAVHIINAPSPAATASLAIGGEVTRRVLGMMSS